MIKSLAAFLTVFLITTVSEAQKKTYTPFSFKLKGAQIFCKETNLFVHTDSFISKGKRLKKDVQLLYSRSESTCEVEVLKVKSIQSRMPDLVIYGDIIKYQENYYDTKSTCDENMCSVLLNTTKVEVLSGKFMGYYLLHGSSFKVISSKRVYWRKYDCPPWNTECYY